MPSLWGLRGRGVFQWQAEHLSLTFPLTLPCSDAQDAGPAARGGARGAAPGPWGDCSAAPLTSGSAAPKAAILSKFPDPIFSQELGCLVNSLNCQHNIYVCQKYWLDKSRR